MEEMATLQLHTRGLNQPFHKTDITVIVPRLVLQVPFGPLVLKTPFKQTRHWGILVLSPAGRMSAGKDLRGGVL